MINPDCARDPADMFIQKRGLEGVGGGWEGSMTTSVDAWERGPSELDHFWIGGFTLPFFPALVGALTSAWIDTGSLEATF